MEISIKKFLKKLFYKKKNTQYSEKGGWPGLKILPKVDYLIDIGVGHQGTEGLYKFFPEAIKYFIDPLEETKSAVSHYLQDSRNKFFNCALSSKKGYLELFVREPISQSGLNAKFKEKAGNCNRRLVSVETLDSLFPKGTFDSSYGIKIDVEGHELEVINGGSKLIAESKFLIVETSLSKKRFNSSPSFNDIYSYMVQINFEIASIRVSKDGIDHCDIAFIRKES